MKKLYSIVLMATALLVSTNVKAVDVATDAALRQAITEAVPGTPLTITLTADIALSSGRIDISDGKDITLNLNGKNLTSCSDPGFYILQGKLSFTGNGHYSSTGDCVVLKGSEDPTASNYSVCYVGPDVTIESLAVGVYYNVWITQNNKHAYGAKVIIDGTLTGDPTALYINGTVQDKTGNIAEFYVNETAQIYTTNASKAAIYAAGYAIWHIAGTVQAATGLYAKAGDIHIDGGTIIADAATYVEATPNPNGYTGGQGCAIIYDSKTGYAGDMQLTVTGDAQIESQTTDGYAIQEVKTDAIESKTESITIESGTINGSVEMTAEVAETVKVNGTITGGTFDTDITGYLNNVTGVVTPVDDGNGNTVYVIEEKPNADPWITDIASATAASYVRLTGSYSATLAADAQAKYLVMQDNAKIIIPAGKKLTAGEVVMGENTVIEVMAGGKLIITDAQGLVANYASNLVLHTSETEQAIFLLNPAVASNKHPKATVEFISKSFVKSGSSEWARQCFGIPSIDELSSITTEGNVPTVFGVFNYSANTWDKVAGINKAPYTEDWSKIANPFEYYQMINYAENPGTKVIMKGALVGNEDPQLSVRGNFWNGYANSFMAPMNMEQLMNMIPDDVQKAIYLLDLTSEQFSWEPFDFTFLTASDAIMPLQPFLIRNANAAGVVEVDYADAVYYTPAGSGETKPSPSPAPARSRVASDFTRVKLVVKGENCIDRVGVAEGEEFSADFDNGYDAVKYMNDGFNMYVSADEKMAIFATDNLNNTYVGLQTVKGGNYTIEFTNVQGEELTLIDHETGARVAMVEGATYEFTADANSTNDYRFEVVSPRKVTTAIENAEAVKNAKGIYTITGQYMGEMNVWNSLPAGVYVVNGEKRVK